MLPVVSVDDAALTMVVLTSLVGMLIVPGESFATPYAAPVPQ